MNRMICIKKIFVHTLEPSYRIAVYFFAFLLFISGCEPLDLKRVMDTSTNDVEVSGTSVVAIGTALDIGDAPIISHGHCWSTSPGPTVDNFKTDLGSIDHAGEFTSKLYGIVPGIKHYVRSYMYNGAEYIYGDELPFEITADDLEFNSAEIEELQIGSVLVRSSTIGVGSINFSNHGHCWSQTDPPTIADNKTAFGQFKADTSFVSQINNLTLGVYYIRGYLESEGGVIYTNSVRYESTIWVETGIVSVNPSNSAIAYGKINSLGVSPIVEHGHCWSTLTSSPNINNEHSSLGSTSTLGNYSSEVDGLISGRKYYIRAYATDGSKVFYGDIKSFVAN